MLNIYILTLNQSLFDYFLNNSFFFYNYTYNYNYILPIFYNNNLVINYSLCFFDGYSYLFKFHKEISDLNIYLTYSEPWSYGYLYNFKSSYITSYYYFNTSGRPRFSSDYQFGSHLFFNSKSNFWLYYTYFFFENYDSFSFRSKNKSYSTILSYSLRLNDLKNKFLYYSNNENFDVFQSDVLRNYITIKGFTPYRVNLVLFENIKNLFLNLKLNIYYSELPSNIGLNYLIFTGYMANNSLKIEKGIFFNLLNDYLFNGLAVELLNKNYGSIYSKFFLNLFTDVVYYRTDNYFSNIYDLNQHINFSNRYTYFNYKNISYYNFFNNSSFSKDSFNYFLDTLNFSNMQSVFVEDINKHYIATSGIYKFINV
jgi:hypothetical protein